MNRVRAKLPTIKRRWTKRSRNPCTRRPRSPRKKWFQISAKHATSNHSIDRNDRRIDGSLDAIVVQAMLDEGRDVLRQAAGAEAAEAHDDRASPRHAAAAGEFAANAVAGRRAVRPSRPRLLVPGTPSTAICSGLPVTRGPAELLAISAPRAILTIGWGALECSMCI
jgi:hypothetical protein